MDDLVVREHDRAAIAGLGILGVAGGDVPPPPDPDVREARRERVGADGDGDRIRVAADRQRLLHGRARGQRAAKVQRRARAFGDVDRRLIRGVGDRRVVLDLGVVGDEAQAERRRRRRSDLDHLERLARGLDARPKALQADAQQPTADGRHPRGVERRLDRNDRAAVCRNRRFAGDRCRGARRCRRGARGARLLRRHGLRGLRRRRIQAADQLLVDDEHDQAQQCRKQGATLVHQPLVSPGTGSRPAAHAGRQRSTRRAANQPPRTSPWRTTAPIAYAEQVGSKRQLRGRSGESVIR